MASSDNLASLEPWLFRPSFLADPWFSADPLVDTALPKGLTKSISDTTATAVNPFPTTNTTSDADGLFSSPIDDALSEFLRNAASHSISVSGSVSGSDPDSAAPKRTRSTAAGPAPASRKVAKRKPRASKKSSTTTFITADAANFRQMVQQVTGVKFPPGASTSMGSILKPEPHRIGGGAGGCMAGGMIGAAAGCLPTLDTSAFLLDHHRRQAVAHRSGAAAASVVMGGTQSLVAGMEFQAPGVGDGTGVTTGAGGDANGGFDFDSYACFPTLESWEAHVE